MRETIIQLIDAFDHYILRHRFYSFCKWISFHPWWGVDWNSDEDFKETDLMDSLGHH